MIIARTVAAWWEGLLETSRAPAAPVGFLPAPAVGGDQKTASWLDYQLAFRVPGGPDDPLNPLHQLAFEQMYKPAWRGTPGPLAGTLIGRAVLAFSHRAWWRREALTPSRVLGILSAPGSPAGRGWTLVVTDPTCAARARILLPNGLHQRGASTVVEVADLSDGSRHTLVLDPLAERWTYAGGGSLRAGGPDAGGQLLLIPPSILRRVPLPLVAPGMESQDAPLSLALLSGRARSAEAPDEAPWWLVAATDSRPPEGYLLNLPAGRSFTHAIEAWGAYAYSFLEAGLGLQWRADGPPTVGYDLIRVARDRQHTRLQVRTDSARRDGSLELVQTLPDRRSSRTFRLFDFGLPPGAALEVWSDSGARTVSVACRTRVPIAIGLEIEAGWAGRFQRRRLPRIPLWPGEEHTISPERWQALGLGPIRHEVRRRVAPAEPAIPLLTAARETRRSSA